MRCPTPSTSSSSSPLLRRFHPPSSSSLPSLPLPLSLLRFYSSPSSPPPPPSPLHAARTHAQSLLSSLNLSAKSRAKAFSDALAALELERKLGEVGGKINRATGYEEIERLRVGVGEKEKALLRARESAAGLKEAYTSAVARRTASQKEVNDLLQRKSTWNGTDVMRFTELIQQDHENDQQEHATKLAMDLGEKGVEKGFSDLMQAILERYHEEQVWSDKIRSLSTYGTLAITSLNVFLFIITLLLVEPWKRKRLVEGVESRLRDNTITQQQETNSTLSSLHNQLQQAQQKLDALLLPPPPLFSSSTPPALPSSSSSDSEPTPPPLDLDPPPTSTSTTDPEPTSESEIESINDPSPVEPKPEVEESTLQALLSARKDWELKEREKELLMVGVAGTVVGVGVSLLIGMLGR